MLHMGLARAIAARYRGRGIADDDLTQAASMALLKAARNFDPDRGVEFLSYAVVTMKGEVKRQFRDFGWMVRPPRPIQKLQADLSRADGELTHQLGRSPKVSEVAAHLGVGRGRRGRGAVRRRLLHPDVARHPGRQPRAPACSAS